MIAFGFWAWELTESWLRFVIAFGLPIGLAAVWGIFAVPNDPSRSGKAPIATNGFIRLLLELGFFAFAGWCLLQIGLKYSGIVFISLVVIHYITSYDRIKWLIRQ